MTLFKGLFDFLNKYFFAYILKFFMGICGNNFALSIFLFTLVINIALIPLSIKSQKASVGQTKIKPRLDALKKKYGDDKQKFNTEMQKLYQEENISMGGGCLPLIIRLFLIMSVYYLVIAPLTYLTNLPADVITKAEEFFEISAKKDFRAELTLIGKIAQDTENHFPDVLAKVKEIDFNFFGIDLTKTPHFSLNFADEELILWIIPLLAFLAALFSGIISMVMQKKINPDAPSMAGMMLTMPFMSLFIAFAAPASLGFYWACSSLIGGVIQAGVQQFYGPYKMIAKENAKAIVSKYEKENKIIGAKSDNDSI